MSSSGTLCVEAVWVTVSHYISTSPNAAHPRATVSSATIRQFLNPRYRGAMLEVVRTLGIV